MSLYLDIEKDLGDFRLQVRLEAEDETLALLGASGCGKSMTLQCIAGIERPDRGRIVVDGVTLFDSEKGIDLPPQQRRTGLLFQNYGLFPHMTVLQNLSAGARREKSRSKRQAAVQTVLEGFGLQQLAGRYPHQLSGGEQQRVALGRILVSDPRILLLDEPFSALDSHLRFRLEQQLRQVIRQFGKTVLLVSHDRDEVFRMADSIALMEQGRVQVCGEKRAVFAAPRTRQGALLTGCRNISALRRGENGRAEAVDWGLELFLPQLPDWAGALGIRGQDLRPGEGENALRCRVTERVENPFSLLLTLQPLKEGACGLLTWETGRENPWQPGEEVTVQLPAEAFLPLAE